MPPDTGCCVCCLHEVLQGFRTLDARLLWCTQGKPRLREDGELITSHPASEGLSQESMPGLSDSAP